MGAQGRAWHSEHFVCTVCDGDLSQVCKSSKFVFYPFYNFMIYLLVISLSKS